MRNKPVVFLLQEVLPNYRVPFLRRLAAVEDFRLLVVYSEPSASMVFESITATTRLEGVATVLVPVPSEMPMRYWLRIVRLFFRERPDVVIMGSRMRSHYLLSIAKRLFRFRLVLWAGGVPFRDKDSINQAIAEMTARRISVNPFTWFLKQCDAFVFYSEHARHTYLEAFRLARERTFVAPNSPDTDIYFAAHQRREEVAREASTLRKRIAPDGEFIMCTIGRLTKERRVAMLFDVFAEISEHERSTVLLVIGDGPERQALEQQARQAGLRVFFEGEITDDVELSRYLSITHIFLYSGVASLAVKIAMSMGVPVAGFDRGLEVHDLDDGVNAIVVRWGDTGLLAKRVLQIIRDDQLRTQMGDKAFATMKHRVNLDLMIAGFRDAISYCRRTQHSAIVKE